MQNDQLEPSSPVSDHFPSLSRKAKTLSLEDNSLSQKLLTLQQECSFHKMGHDATQSLLKQLKLENEELQVKYNESLKDLLETRNQLSETKKQLDKVNSFLAKKVVEQNTSLSLDLSTGIDMASALNMPIMMDIDTSPMQEPQQQQMRVDLQQQSQSQAQSIQQQQVMQQRQPTLSLQEPSGLLQQSAPLQDQSIPLRMTQAIASASTIHSGSDQQPPALHFQSDLFSNTLQEFNNAQTQDFSNPILGGMSRDFGLTGSQQVLQDIQSMANNNIHNVLQAQPPIQNLQAQSGLQQSQPSLQAMQNQQSLQALKNQQSLQAMQNQASALQGMQQSQQNLQGMQQSQQNLQGMQQSQQNLQGMQQSQQNLQGMQQSQQNLQGMQQNQASALQAMHSGQASTLQAMLDQPSPLQGMPGQPSSLQAMLDQPSPMQGMKTQQSPLQVMQSQQQTPLQQSLKVMQTQQLPNQAQSSLQAMLDQPSPVQNQQPLQGMPNQSTPVQSMQTNQSPLKPMQNQPMQTQQSIQQSQAQSQAQHLQGMHNQHIQNLEMQGIPGFDNGIEQQSPMNGIQTMQSLQNQQAMQGFQHNGLSNQQIMNGIQASGQSVNAIQNNVMQTPQQTLQALQNNNIQAQQHIQNGFSIQNQHAMDKIQNNVMQSISSEFGSGIPLGLVTPSSVSAPTDFLTPPSDFLSPSSSTSTGQPEPIPKLEFNPVTKRQQPQNEVPWLPEENTKLSESVDLHAQNWEVIGKLFPTRTIQELQDQWAEIQPKKGKWSKEEDEKLLAAYSLCSQEDPADPSIGGNTASAVFWYKIAGYIPGRSGRQCQTRYIETLDPAVKKGKWSAEEDQCLKEGWKNYGRSWVKVSSMVPGRTQRQCRTRWMQIYKDVQDTPLVPGVGGLIGAEVVVKSEPVSSKSPPSEFEDDSDAYDTDLDLEGC